MPNLTHMTTYGLQEDLRKARSKRGAKHPQHLIGQPIPHGMLYETQIRAELARRCVKPC